MSMYPGTRSTLPVLGGPDAICGVPPLYEQRYHDFQPCEWADEDVPGTSARRRVRRITRWYCSTCLMEIERHPGALMENR